MHTPQSIHPQASRLTYFLVPQTHTYTHIDTLIHESILSIIFKAMHATAKYMRSIIIIIKIILTDMISNISKQQKNKRAAGEATLLVSRAENECENKAKIII